MIYKIPTTFANFRANTGLNGKASKRGTNIRRIDIEFDNYETHFPNGSDQGNTQNTLDLYQACEHWLKLKQDKSAVTGVVIKTANKNLTRRRTAISEIAKQCVNALRNGKALDDRKASFQTRKVQMLAKGAERVQATPLSGSYGTERATWVGSGKTVSIAGHFHTTQQEMADIGMDQGNFNGMSKPEYSAFLQGKKQHVLYFKKDTRLTTIMDFGDGGLTLRPGVKNVLMDCLLPPFAIGNSQPFIAKLWMYAMDSYGNLFGMANPEFETLQALTQALGQNQLQISNFNHSSFNAGREVICAGLIGFHQGYVAWIDNNSGHYKPSRKSLKDAVEFMADEGRNLSQLRIGAYHYLPNGNIARIEVHTPQHYLINVDANGDIGTV